MHLCMTVNLRQERYVVVREPSGTLRDAECAERSRLLNTFFPQVGRHSFPPIFLQGEDLQVFFVVSFLVFIV